MDTPKRFRNNNGDRLRRTEQAEVRDMKPSSHNGFSNGLGNTILAVVNHRFQDLGHDPARISRAVRVDQKRPEGSEGMSKFGDQLRCHLANSLRLFG